MASKQNQSNINYMLTAMGLNSSQQSAKILCFLAILKKYGVNLEKIDFSDRANVENGLREESRNLKSSNKELAEILVNIIEYDVLEYSDEINTFFHKINKLNNDEIIKAFYSLNDIDSKSDSSFNSITDINLIKIILNLVDSLQFETVLDLCSGQGVFLNECSKMNPKLKLNGFDISKYTILKCKMNLFVNHVNANIQNYDVLNTPMNEKYDLVFSEYPWGLKVSDNPVEDKDMIVDYKINRMRSDWNFIFKAINATNKIGQTVVIAPTGILYNTADIQSRKEIVDKSLLNTVILMPTATHSITNASYVILLFSRDNKEVKFIDARNCFENAKTAHKSLKVNDILDLLKSNHSEFVISVNESEIKGKNYNLDPNQYFNNVSKIDLINPKKVKEISEVLSGYQYTSKKVEELEIGVGNVSVVKISNIVNGVVDYDSLVSINIDEDRIKKYLLKENDILITAKGTSIKVGLILGINNRKIIPYNNLQIIRILDKNVNPIYVCNYLNSETGQMFLKSLQTGSAIINITKNSLLELPIPVVDIDTQETIANRYLILSKSLKEYQEKLATIEKKINSIYDDEIGG